MFDAAEFLLDGSRSASVAPAQDARPAGGLQQRVNAVRDEQSKLHKIYLDQRRKWMDAALSGDDGERVRQLAAWAQLVTAGTAGVLVDAVRGATWLHRAHEHTRITALRLLGEAIGRLREAHDVPAIDDPIPGEPDDAWTLIRRIFDQPATDLPQPPPPEKGTNVIRIELTLDTAEDARRARAALAALLAGTLSDDTDDDDDDESASASAGTDTGAGQVAQPARRGRGRPRKAPDDTAKAPASVAVAPAAPDPDPLAALLDTGAPEPAAPAEAPPTIEQLTAALQAYGKIAGPIAVVDMLKAFNARRLSEVQGSQYGALRQALREKGIAA